MIRFNVVLLLISLCVFFPSAVFAQNIDFDAVDEQIAVEEELESVDLLEQKTVFALVPPRDRTFSLHAGIGYRYTHWAFTFKRANATSQGFEDSLVESTGYQVLWVDSKFIVMLWKNTGLYTAMNISLPLSASEAVYPLIAAAGINAVNSSFILKNLSEQTDLPLKGVGLDFAFGPLYRIFLGALTVNIGGGLATNVFLEDLSLGTQIRGTWGLGVNMDVGFEYHLTEMFGFTVGIAGSYFPITFLEINNAVDAFRFTTSSFANIGLHLSTVWYF